MHEYARDLSALLIVCMAVFPRTARLCMVDFPCMAMAFGETDLRIVMVVRQAAGHHQDERHQGEHHGGYSIFTCHRKCSEQKYHFFNRKGHRPPETFTNHR